MSNPWIVLVASLIPGLGFALQTKMKAAAISFFLVIALLVVYVLAPWELVYQVSFGLFLLAWMGQGILAFDSARRAIRIKNGTSRQPRLERPLPGPPSDLPRSKRLSFRAHRVVEQQLESGEHVRAALFATAAAGFGTQFLLGPTAGLTMKQYYVALTDAELVFVQLDLWGKPAEVTRQARDRIKSASLAKGLLSDTLTLNITERKPLKLKLPRNQRDEASLISDAIGLG